MRIIRPHLMAVTFKKVHVETFRTIRYLDHGSYIYIYVTWHRKRGDFDIFQLSSFLLSFSSLDIK